MLGIILGMYISTILLLNVPAIQRQLSILVSKELTSVLHSDLTIGQVNIGMLNRIIIDNLQLHDQTGKEMLKITRFSAKFDLLPLLQGKISISNIQLFGFNINIEKATPTDKPNFQFVLDAFASKDTVKKESNLDLRINSLLIRRGKMSYNVLSEPKTPGKFNPQHIQLKNIIANISLKALQKDSVNAAIKRMSIEEAESGFELKKLSLKVVGNKQRTKIENFGIDLANTSLKMDTIHMEYDSLSAFDNFAQNVRFAFHLQPSHIVLKDLSPFIPALSSFKDKIELEIETGGTLNNLNCSKLSLTAGRSFHLKGDVSFQDLSSPQNAYVMGNLNSLYANQDGIAFFVRNLSKQYTGVPPILQHLGTVSFNGQISGYFTDLVTYGKIRSDVGSIHTDVMLTSNKEKGVFAYLGDIETENFDLNKLLANDKLGKITFNLKVDGKHIKEQYPDINLKGLIASVDYSGYTYESINLDGKYQQGGFAGSLFLNDPNGTFALNGMFNTVAHTPTFNFTAALANFRPHDLQLTPAYEDTEMSIKLRANFTGGSIDEMNGEINIDSLQVTSPDNQYLLDNLKITAIRKNKHEKSLHIASNFLQGKIEGDYSYKTLPTSIQNILHRYLPALIEANDSKIKTENNFRFDLHVHNTDLLYDVLQIPLKVYAHSTIKGYVNDKAERLRVEGYFPRLLYKDKFIESGVLLCENSGDRIQAKFRFNNRKKDGAINLAVETEAKEDRLSTTVNWGNSSALTYGGRLSALTNFVRAEESDGQASKQKRFRNKNKKAERGALKTTVDILPTQIILSDTLWEVHPSQVVIDSGKVHINNFYFSHENRRHLRVNGTLSKLPEDTVRLDLKDINIGYIFDIADLGVSFQGEATGPALASGVLDKPVMQTDLSIRNFGLFGGPLGNANIHGEWHHDVKGILLDAHIEEENLSQTNVYGFVYPIKPTSALDLQIKAQNTNLKFIHNFLEDITPEFKARVTGDVHLYGKFKALTMQGRVLGDASLKIAMLNTMFNVKDSILIEPDGLTFNNNRVFDEVGRQGRMSGYLRYNHFKDMRYQFNFNLNNMLVMNTQESPDYPFYGTVYGTGNVTLSGNARDGLNVDLALSTNRNSVFTYIKDNVTTATSNQFIRFVDKTPRRAVQDSVQLSIFELAQKEIKQQDDEGDSDLRLNLQLEATPDATMRIIMDPIAGDYISGRGTGNIRAEFYNKGDFKMFGNYRLSQGVYKFSLQEVIRKDFNISDGSTISFSGAPEDANLDIQAAYTVNSASLNDLMPNASEYVTQTSVKVNCTMGISWQLTSPTVKLGLELPNERDEVQALVRNYIPTDEQMNMQILYLLGIGKFYTPENVEATQNSNMMSSVLSSTLSGQLNNALSQVINSNNWNIGTNLSTGEGWNDMEFAGMLSGQLLNNRLLINGNFGYRENPMANTNFVGDFEAEWLVTRSGDIRLKAYNETNDRYYTQTNLTTQGIGIIFKKEFNKWSDLLFWNKWKLRRLEKKQSQPKREATEQTEPAPTQQTARAKEKRAQ